MREGAHAGARTDARTFLLKRTNFSAIGKSQQFTADNRFSVDVRCSSHFWHTRTGVKRPNLPIRFLPLVQPWQNTFPQCLHRRMLHRQHVI